MHATCAKCGERTRRRSMITRFYNYLKQLVCKQCASDIDATAKRRLANGVGRKDFVSTI